MPLLCLDVGSTWTKGALVSEAGELLGTAQHATTAPEVLRGVDAVAAALEPGTAARAADLGSGAPGSSRTAAQAGGAVVPVLLCSSAGGGLRLAVVGQERLVSAEAGHRVALSAGAKVVHVSDGELDGAGLRALRAASPDVVLLVGGTDGGDQRTLLHNASRLAANRVRVPIILAGNTAARAEALTRLAGRTVVVTDNVLPDIGELAPAPARAAIREVFLRHVIGGKSLSRGPRFRRLVRAVTPDAVLSGVSLLASATDDTGAVLVVDVGGATTDVYSAVSTVDETAGAVGLPTDRRTVEGDIGMRWSAPGVVAAATADRLIGEADGLAGAAAHRAAAVDWVPTTPEESTVDLRLAALAARIALRRHIDATGGRFGPRGIGLLILSGGPFRHAESVAEVETALRSDPALRPHLRTAAVAVDTDYVLAPAGLLAAAGHRSAAENLLTTRLRTTHPH
ncbi:Protein mutL [Actinokineospora spheciospongiae]|uniref:Protein mutL n=1 Tax=Actinokineospora spheciospongiae TaxID=909613 RepID=W7JF45_9PSEU|nr:glutamate mutase L [Actinokineospora spheciospongiae]EWC64634.1 Protein mutL [Actinokineospora spheciospongiae]